MLQHSSETSDVDISTDQIKTWRSIFTLVTFVVTNLVVLFPFYLPIPVPLPLWRAIIRLSFKLNILSPSQNSSLEDAASASAVPQVIQDKEQSRSPFDFKVATQRFRIFKFPLNFVTAPLIADLLLLAIGAIGRVEIHDGTIGANHISPIDIMVFFISLAYIAISIDASGLIRYLAFRVLQWGGRNGRRLFFYLYCFFFLLTSFIGNDPVILSGTAFLAYMTRVSTNIRHPKAWTYTQFAVANIASAILVSSNPTNLVLAGAFNIKFITYTANMIVPVVVTGVILSPFLLFVWFNDPQLIPHEIQIHDLPKESRDKAPVNPNIPHARGTAEEEEERELVEDSEKPKVASLEEILNPYLDKVGAAFGGCVMAITLVTLLALNAASTKTGEHPVFWVTLPAAFIMFCFDLSYGWIHRNSTRLAASSGLDKIDRARFEKQVEDEFRMKVDSPRQTSIDISRDPVDATNVTIAFHDSGFEKPISITAESGRSSEERLREEEAENLRQRKELRVQELVEQEKKKRDLEKSKTDAVSIAKRWYKWSQVTFPTATAVANHLPFALVPFAFGMFILVQALVKKGWVAVFAYGWDHWVDATGTIGGIGGMAFLSVILCNFAGTNIGTTILLSRVIQTWQEIHRRNGKPISDRTFWATIYSMAIGVNYGAFSLAFSASLAGLLWRDILRRKHIRVRGFDFLRVNLPIITVSMTVGCAVLLGQVYITRDDTPYDA